MERTRGTGEVSERLRVFVRRRVHKDGDLYQHGAAIRLARFLEKPSSWVSHYVDDPPMRNADLDTALRICAFFRVSIFAFQKEGPASAPVVQVKPPVKHVARAIKILERLDETRQQRAVVLLADLLVASVQERHPGSSRRRGGTPTATARTAPGRRRAAEESE